MNFLFLILFFLLPFFSWQNISAYEATSTSFLIIQNIQSISGGNSTSTLSTSTSFSHFGAGGQSGVGIGTSTSFTTHAGFISEITKKRAASQSGTLTFTVDSNTKAFGIITPGVVASATSSLNTITDNSSGFTISVSRSDSDTTMDLDSNASINIVDKTSWNPGANCASAGNATASTTEAQTLQFRIRVAGTDSSSFCSAWWGADDTTANALFAGFPATTKSIVYRSSAAISQVSAIALYNLTVPTTQNTGDYSGTITYTIVANP